MFARSASALALLLALLSPGPAFARVQNFGTKSPLGLGFRAGLEKSPRADFIVNPQKISGSYSRFFSFEPFLDFGNFVFRAGFALHNHPRVSADGSDAGGTFSEESNSHSVGYGLQLMLVPYYNEALTQRFYVTGGLGNVTTKAKNSRAYAGGTSYTERLSGSGMEYKFGVGYEFYFVQTYSLQLEAGYRTLTIENFSHSEGGDLSGKPKSTGEAALDALSGRAKKFHQDSPYLSLALNLNF